MWQAGLRLGAIGNNRIFNVYGFCRERFGRLCAFGIKVKCYPIIIYMAIRCYCGAVR